MRRASLVLGLAALSGFAAAQKVAPISLGVSAGAYFLTDSKMRDVFGNTVLTFGVTTASLHRPEAGKLAVNYNVITGRKDDSLFVMVPVTLGYEYHFGGDTSGYVQKTSNTLPYARIEAGAAYYDVAIHDGGNDQSFKAGGAFGGAEIGVVFNDRIGVNARYNLAQERFGVNLSGFSVGLTYIF